MSEHAALLQIDIVDSTKLGEALGDVAMSALWTEHDRMARDLLREWRGKEIDKSDGFLLLFADAGDAVGYAMAYHRALEQLRPRIRARAGVHAGSVITRANPARDVARGAKPLEVEGVVKPITSRVMSLAEAGQTLLTGQARAALAPTGLRLQSHGHWRFKGVAQPFELFEAGDEQTRFHPPADGAKAFRVVAAGDTWVPASDIRHTLPAERDAFFGRSDVLQSLYGALSGESRLVTIAGVGGIGKTRLVLHFARSWIGEFPGGVWFCDLSQARNDDGVYAAVAVGLDIPLGRGDPRVQLAQAIRGRGACLVILDNFEQIVRLATQTIGYWLDMAPEARFVVTSREVLSLPGERVLPLEGLLHDEAIALFDSRARAVSAESAFGSRERAAIDRLVDLLDRMPLALELAAARLRLMTPTAIVARISERFELLVTTKGRVGRQAALRTTFDWSWDLLDNPEKAALAQLSVFAGGFTLEAVEAVLRLPPESTPLDALQSLVEKSWVRSLGGRFDLFESVREYAYERLRADAGRSGWSRLGVADAEAAHGAYFASRNYEDLKKENYAEIDNAIVANRRATRRGNAELAAGTCINAWYLLKVRGPHRTAAELCDVTLALEGIPEMLRIRLLALRAESKVMLGDSSGAREDFQPALKSSSKKQQGRAMSMLADLDLFEGRMSEALEGYELALRLGEELDDARLRCSVLNGLGEHSVRLGKYLEAKQYFDRALLVAQDAGDLHWEGSAVGNLGQLHANLGDNQQALARYEDQVRIARQIGDRLSEGTVLCNLGLLYHAEGQSEQARERLVESLLIAREVGYARLQATVCCNLGIVLEALGDQDRALQSYRDALALARSRSDVRSEGQFLGYFGQLQARLGNMQDARVALSSGAELLRRVGDRISLAILLAAEVQARCIQGDYPGADRALSEAESIAATSGVLPDSELALAVGDARRRLAELKASLG